MVEDKDASTVPLSDVAAIPVLVQTQTARSLQSFVHHRQQQLARLHQVAVHHDHTVVVLVGDQDSCVRVDSDVPRLSQLQLTGLEQTPATIYSNILYFMTYSVPLSFTTVTGVL